MNTISSAVAGFILRAPNREETAAFYRKIGLNADHHQHGGPAHFELGPTDPGCVAEIYRRTENFSSDAIMIRTADIDAALSVLGVEAVCKDVGDMRLTYISDPDGRAVMLYQLIGRPIDRAPDTLAQQRCLPCSGVIPSLTQTEIENLFAELNWWILNQAGQLEKTFTFENFSEAVGFVHAIEPIAETEDHHPDIHIEKYKTVRITLITHAIKALSINDFIIAAKIDAI
jgi:4a-hydroxytetrahydrobiopterin dehydratase